MSTLFNQFWSQFWLQDTVEEETTDATWHTLFADVRKVVPRQTQVNCPKTLWHTIQRMKTHKAIGVDGWYSEELRQLAWHMVVYLSQLLSQMWTQGLTTQQMQARTFLFAKCDKPENMSHGRPITILGYLARLSSKLVADQVLHHWAQTWPPELSGGLPRRSARDLSLQQLMTIESANTHRTA